MIIHRFDAKKCSKILKQHKKQENNFLQIRQLHITKISLIQIVQSLKTRQIHFRIVNYTCLFQLGLAKDIHILDL